jgi:LysM repeat protein
MLPTPVRPWAGHGIGGCGLTPPAAPRFERRERKMKLLKSLLPLLMVLTLMAPQAAPALADASYVVQPGDNLFTISLKFGVNMTALITANGITNPNFIYVGQRLVIPGASGAPAAPTTPVAGTTYVVQSGDSLSKIARKFGVSLSALAAANSITNLNLVYVGESLVIPGTGGPAVPAAPAATPTASAPIAGSQYFVQSGDTLYKIAQKFGVDPLALIAANGIINPNLIYVGQKLTIPGASGAPAAATATPVATAAPTSTPTATPTATGNPTAVPTATPIPTLPSGGFTSHGLTGDSFWIENPTAGVNQPVWFDFQVSNPTADSVPYAVLAAHTDAGPNAQSWTNQTFKPYSQLVWRDHIYFSSGGTYQVYLGICYNDKNACLSNSLTWDRLSNSVTVIIH